jgi:hypothetical protein
VAILSPSFPNQPRFNDRRGDSDDATDADRDPNEATDTDRKCPTREAVAEREHEKRQRADDPPQQTGFTTRAHASG